MQQLSVSGAGAPSLGPAPPSPPEDRGRASSPRGMRGTSKRNVFAPGTTFPPNPGGKEGESRTALAPASPCLRAQVPAGFLFLPWCRRGASCCASGTGSETPRQLNWDRAASFPCLQGARGNQQPSGLSAIFVAAFEKCFLRRECHLLPFKRAHQSGGGWGKVVLRAPRWAQNQRPRGRRRRQGEGCGGNGELRP